LSGLCSAVFISGPLSLAPDAQSFYVIFTKHL